MNPVKNVEKAVKILSDKPAEDGPLPWQKYAQARRIFFIDFTYVLRTTGPGYQFLAQPPSSPDSFESRDVATGLLVLGQNYQHCVDQATVLTDLEGRKVENKDRSMGLGSREWTRRKTSPASLVIK